MNTQKLKELMQRIHSATKGCFPILSPGDIASVSAYIRELERERDELRKTLKATQGGATEAIKNVMRLQEEISRLDKESQRLSDQLGACDRQRLDWLKRALTAEAEIARRDTAAGEPEFYVRYRSDGGYEGPLHKDATEECRKQSWSPLYAAAAPAVLASEVEELSMLIRRLVHTLKNSNPHSGLLWSVPDFMHRKGYWKESDCLRGGND